VVERNGYGVAVPVFLSADHRETVLTE
jgi:hypothetical protein